MKTYPRSALAPSAQYWIGNAQFAQRDFRGAIATQRQLIAAYPDSLEGAGRDAQHRDRAARSGRRRRRAAHARGPGREVPASPTPRSRRSSGSPPMSQRIRARGAPFAARLSAWQRMHGRHDLPWQRTRDAYRIWLSEIMLQQTQVATVIPYYERFLAAFPDVARARRRARGSRARALERLGLLPPRASPARGGESGRRGARWRASARGRCARRTSRHRPLDGRGDRGVRVRRARGDSRRQREARARAASRHRGLSGRAAASRARCGASPSRCCPNTTIETYTQALMDLGATVCTRSVAALRGLSGRARLRRAPRRSHRRAAFAKAQKSVAAARRARAA